MDPFRRSPSGPVVPGIMQRLLSANLGAGPTTFTTAGQKDVVTAPLPPNNGNNYATIMGAATVVGDATLPATVTLGYAVNGVDYLSEQFTLVANARLVVPLSVGNVFVVDPLGGLVVTLKYNTTAGTISMPALNGICVVESAL